MLCAVSWVVVLGSAALAVIQVVRVRGDRPDAGWLEAWVLGGATWLLVGGLVGCALAVLGQFAPVPLGVGLGMAALVGWVSRARTVRVPPSRTDTNRWHLVAGAIVLALGAAVRLPLNDYQLAGRDQGTYQLRAFHTARSGALDLHDGALASAARDRGARPGPDDILGLYTQRTEPWRRGWYEAAYRPGLYLADVETGHVVPQFFHLHPTVLAWWELALGHGRGIWVLVLESLLFTSALWAVGRRLWPGGPWALGPPLLHALSPLGIWVGRTALTETLTGTLLLATVLIALRERDAPRRELGRAGLLMGGIGFVRGNGWVATPVTLAVLLLTPRGPRSWIPGAILGATLVASVGLHAHTTYPYVFDELVRQLDPDPVVTPTRLTATAAVGAIGWLVAHRVVSRFGVPFVPTLPRILVLAGLGGLAWYGYMFAPGPPYSRLDPWLPLVGWPVTILAAAGLGWAAWRWRPNRTPAEIWLLAAASVAIGTIWLYAPRNLPQLGLYYYGRYLVPELMPLCHLAAVAALRGVWTALGRWRWSSRRHLPAIATAAGFAIALGSTAGVLVTKPLSRMQEFEGASRVIDHIAHRTPPDAIIIAGGEGWHHGHTFNQVGGAVHLGHGRTVLPYRDREAAYAVLHELLVAGPASTGRPAPPVFLLLNEAARAYRPPSGGAPPLVSGIDDVLPAPFAADRIDLLELKVHRLTPVSDRVPDRLTRDDLRMALLRISVDPTRQAAVRTWRFDGSKGAAGLRITGGADGPGRRCLTPESPLRLEWIGSSPSGPGALVVVAAPGTPDQVAHWSVSFDDTPRDVTPAKMPTRIRSTLGPFAYARAPKMVTIKGSRDPAPGAACPYGGVAEIRLLPPDRAYLSKVRAEGFAYVPAHDFGHPYEPTAWVSGRGLSRYRPGIQPRPTIKALSLLLTKKQPLSFAPAPMPDHGPAPLHLVVTSTKSKLGKKARIVVFVDDREVARLDPPNGRVDRVWQSAPIEIRPAGPVGRIRLELRGARRRDGVRVRDVGLFAAREPIAAELIRDDTVPSP